MPVTWVTGAAGFLGTAVVRRLVRDGHRVAAVDQSSREERLERLATEDSAVAALVGDCTTAEDVRSSVSKAEATLGAVTGAVLVAGGWQGGAPFHAEGPDVWPSMMAMNLETARQSLRVLLPALVERQAGSIVLIGSRVVERPWEGANAAAYTASKAALVALAQAAASEVVASGVRINTVLPSTIDTPANRSAMPDADHDTWVAPDDIAGVVAFLLSDESRAVSGASIPIYGRS